jgi:hypothetical protein
MENRYITQRTKKERRREALRDAGLLTLLLIGAVSFMGGIWALFVFVLVAGGY